MFKRVKNGSIRHILGCTVVRHRAGTLIVAGRYATMGEVAHAVAKGVEVRARLRG